MDFIDLGSIQKEHTNQGRYINRRVICEICSVVKDNYYMEKVIMNFDYDQNVYTCPNYKICHQKVSGVDVEKIIYFNNRDFIYEPTEDEKAQVALKIKLGGVDEDGNVPESDFVNLLDQPQSP